MQLILCKISIGNVPICLSQQQQGHPASGVLWAGLQLLQQLGLKIVIRGATGMIHWFGKAEISSGHGRVHIISREKTSVFKK